MSMLVGFEAPNFTSPAIMPDNSFKESFNFMEYVGDNIGVLFFYTMNFSYLCPAELIAINNRMKEFAARGAKVAAVSCDTQLSHLEYKNRLPEQGGIGNVEFPLVADIAKVVAKGYDVLVSESVAVRATFVMDRKFIVRHQSINDLPYGRNLDETLRVIDSVNYYYETGHVTPPGWRPGQEGIHPSRDGTRNYLAANWNKI